MRLDLGLTERDKVMDKKIFENSDEDLIVEVMRGGGEQSEPAEDNDKNTNIAGIISKLGSENITRRILDDHFGSMYCGCPVCDL